MSGVRNLHTGDIKGAQADSKLLGSFTFYERRKDQVRPVAQNTDIVGSTAGTLKKGVVSTRVTNPLEPEYQMPGYLEPVEVFVQGNSGQEGFSMGKQVKEVRPHVSAQQQAVKPPRPAQAESK